MRFFTVLTGALTSSVVVSGAVIQQRAVTAQQTVNNLNTLTQMSENLETVVSAIQTGDNAVTKRQDNQFQPMINGYDAINSYGQTLITDEDGTQPFTTADATSVCTAYTNFVTVYQELLTITISKSSALGSVFLGPVAAALRANENILDTVSLQIIDSVPSCVSGATQNKEKLDVTLQKAVCAYSPGGTLGVDLLC